jgi:DHA1 family bicyclomycin/chloramphenicol resistance-like MFS transporter
MKDKEFIVLMALLMSIVAISIDALLPALGYIGQDFAVANENHTQYVITCIFMGMAAGELVWGPLSDALGRKRVLYAGVALYLVGSLFCYLSQEFSMLLVGRIMQGLGVAAPYITTVSIVRDKYAGRDMARIMSVVMTIFMLVPAIAPSLGQGILYFSSWRSIFLLYVIYSIVITLWLFTRLDETLPPEKRIPFTFDIIAHGFREVVGNRITAAYTVCMGICFGSLIGYLNSSRQIFQVQFEAGDAFALYFGILAIVLGISSMINSRLVTRLGMYYISVRGFWLMVAASAVFLAVHLIGVNVTLWMFMLYAGCLFFSFGLVFGNLNAIAMEPMGHIAGIAASVIGCVSSLISMALGAFIGQLYNNTLIPIVVGFLVLGMLCVLIIVWTEKYRHHQAIEG